jgi:hypothetical protein
MSSFTQYPQITALLFSEAMAGAKRYRLGLLDSPPRVSDHPAKQ